MMWRGMMEGAPFLTGRTVAVAGTNAALLGDLSTRLAAAPCEEQGQRDGEDDDAARMIKPVEP